MLRQPVRVFDHERGTENDNHDPGQTGASIARERATEEGNEVEDRRHQGSYTACHFNATHDHRVSSTARGVICTRLEEKGDRISTAKDALRLSSASSSAGIAGED